MNSTVTAGHLPLSVYLALGVYVAMALAWLSVAAVRVTRWEKAFSHKHYLALRWQLSIWLILVGIGTVALMMSWEMIGGLLLFSAQFYQLSK